ncbi:hypothetical protein WICPIJ_000051 [Wickerhamomyces pijperi]|uniref:Uncharacterized protein n=1 Tax=Wickerhamomyces pijperi TaxID=599730 RepID=A0A9P8QHS7_WICPI|nr:hypothetical protein WICPIJ_000051 [Wickerhamomyces pijperi]
MTFHPKNDPLWTLSEDEGFCEFVMLPNGLVVFVVLACFAEAAEALVESVGLTALDFGDWVAGEPVALRTGRETALLARAAHVFGIGCLGLTFSLTISSSSSSSSSSSFSSSSCFSTCSFACSFSSSFFSFACSCSSFDGCGDSSDFTGDVSFLACGLESCLDSVLGLDSLAFCLCSSLSFSDLDLPSFLDFCLVSVFSLVFGTDSVFDSAEVSALGLTSSSSTSSSCSSTAGSSFCFFSSTSGFKASTLASSTTPAAAVAADCSEFGVDSVWASSTAALVVSVSKIGASTFCSSETTSDSLSKSSFGINLKMSLAIR